MIFNLFLKLSVYSFLLACFAFFLIDLLIQQLQSEYWRNVTENKYRLLEIKTNQILNLKEQIKKIMIYNLYVLVKIQTAVA